METDRVESNTTDAPRAIVALLVLVAGVMLSRVWVLQERVMKDRGDVVVVKFRSSALGDVSVSVHRLPDETAQAFAARVISESIQFRKSFEESGK